MQALSFLGPIAIFFTIYECGAILTPNGWGISHGIVPLFFILSSHIWSGFFAALFYFYKMLKHDRYI